MEESTLLIEIAQAEALAERWRRRYDPVARRGMPAHITALFPFRPPSKIGKTEVGQVNGVAAATEPFSFALTGLEEFPGAIWLKPTPDRPFRRLTEALWDAFPDCPPYEGRFPNTQPHLTVAQCATREEQERIKGALEDHIGVALPISCVATALSLFASDSAGTWTRKHRFEFQ